MRQRDGNQTGQRPDGPHGDYGGPAGNDGRSAQRNDGKRGGRGRFCTRRRRYFPVSSEYFQHQAEPGWGGRDPDLCGAQNGGPQTEKEAYRYLLHQPDRTRPPRGDRPDRGARAGDRARDPDPEPPHEKQSVPDRRARRRENRDRGGAGAAHRAGERPRAAEKEGDPASGPDRACRGHPVPGAVRKPHQGPGRRSEGRRRRDFVH